MDEKSELRNRVDRFILDQIDTVSHLEALLLLWGSKPRPWSSSEMARALYVKPSFSERILKDLAKRDLAVEVPENYSSFHYSAHCEETNALVEALDSIYRREIVRISTMIHSKGSAAMQDFAEAFRFTKDR
jgi:hypothetical protein